ncbi:hypothetical protein [Pontibacillus litoralis]|uniref:Uncharacterized protein n=1 Tax=Pontibacillus litoralis JSM 072002 TaxID=1385512 RepID=A0A0A5G400_9BACI|nr:hypothetical protein [Pontibacillus litoralis]KGX86779.1 hypothetical protein N784_04005 [Pontibacillus litoralis JSM 072002]
MLAWKGLWKKEWRLSISFHVFVFMLETIILGLSYWRLYQYDEGIMLGIVILLIGAHIWYLPGCLLYSLNKEARLLHVFLHSPRSIHMLMSTKLLNALLFMFVSLSILSTIGVMLFLNVFNGEISVSQLATIISFSGIHLVGASLYFSTFIFFLWTLHHYLKSYVGKWSLLIVIGTFIGAPILYGWFGMQPLYEMMTQWGAISIDLQSYVQTFQLGGLSAEFATGDVPVVYVGYYVIDFVIFLMLYVIATYLLDRKVEV